MKQKNKKSVNKKRNVKKKTNKKRVKITSTKDTKKKQRHTQNTRHTKQRIKRVTSVKNKHVSKKKVDKKHKEVSKKYSKPPKIDAKKQIHATNILERYTLNVDKAKVNVTIQKKEGGNFYILSLPKIDIGTEALLDEIRKELVSVTSIAAGELVDEKSVIKIKQQFIDDAGKLLKEKVPDMEKNTEDLLVGILIQEMLGLGQIEFLINDPALEEIVIISSKEPVRTYHKKHGWLTTNILIQTEEEINNYSNIIARRVGRQISILTPLLDAHVVTGDRANAVLYPIATKGNTITIRKFSRDPWTIIDLIGNKTVSMDVSAILWLAIEYEMNVLISGGTASGKTVFLNACMPFIPPNHRIISMEDTRELMLPEFLYWCPLVTRAPNPEGKGEVSMLDLLVNSLRMRPDRIILGEIRRQREAEVLFEAMHTGHSVYATVHADSANETIRRLTNPPINVPANMLANVNLNVVMFRDRRRGLRRVLQLAEFIPGKDSINANILYRWVVDNDEIIPHNESLTFIDELSRNTGMSENEINQNLEKKKSILTWLLKNNIRDLDSIGKVMNLYYTHQDALKEIIEKNDVSKIIVKKQISGVESYPVEDKGKIEEDKTEKKPHEKEDEDKDDGGSETSWGGGQERGSQKNKSLATNENKKDDSKHKPNEKEVSNPHQRMFGRTKHKNKKSKSKFKRKNKRGMIRFFN